MSGIASASNNSNPKDDYIYYLNYSSVSSGYVTLCRVSETDQREGRRLTDNIIYHGTIDNNNGSIDFGSINNNQDVNKIITDKKYVRYDIQSQNIILLFHNDNHPFANVIFDFNCHAFLSVVFYNSNNFVFNYADNTFGFYGYDIDRLPILPYNNVMIKKTNIRHNQGIKTRLQKQKEKQKHKEKEKQKQKEKEKEIDSITSKQEPFKAINLLQDLQGLSHLPINYIFRKLHALSAKMLDQDANDIIENIKTVIMFLTDNGKTILYEEMGNHIWFITIANSSIKSVYCLKRDFNFFYNIVVANT